MASIKLTGSVGNPKARATPKVQNRPQDVKLVRQMINANTNTHAVKMSDKVDAELFKAIGVMNIKAKQRPPQYVIDPGDATFKHMLKKYSAKVKEQGKVDYVKFTYGGKEQWVTKPEFIRCKTAIYKKLKKIAKIYRSQYDHYDKICADYDDVAMVNQGMMKAFVHVVSIKTGGVKPVNTKYRFDTATHLNNLDKALAKVKANIGSVRGNGLDGLKPVLKKVEIMLKAFIRDVMRFLKQFSGAAGRAATVLKITATTAFAVLTAMAAPALVAGTSITSAGTAAIAAGTGTKVMESASNELGRHLSGEKLTVTGSLKDIAIDGTVAAITGGIGNKLPLSFLDDAAGPLSKEAMKKVKGLTQEQCKILVKRYMAEGGSEMVKESFSKTVELVGNSFKSGKAPTKADMQAAFCDVVFKGLSAGMLNDMGKFTRGYSMKAYALIPDKMVDEAFAKASKGIPIGKVLRGKILNEVAKKESEAITKAGFDYIVETAQGGEGMAKLKELAQTGVRKNSNVKKRIEAAIAKELKAQKEKV